MNAWTTLTIVAKMPPAATPKGLSTVVANEGTLEMATTVQVGSENSCLALRSFWDFSFSTKKVNVQWCTIIKWSKL